jgi:hypothetical protein
MVDMMANTNQQEHNEIRRSTRPLVVFDHHVNNEGGVDSLAYPDSTVAACHYSNGVNKARWYVVYLAGSTQKKVSPSSGESLHHVGANQTSPEFLSFARMKCVRKRPTTISNIHTYYGRRHK